MSRVLIERSTICLLGNQERCDQLIQWSERNTRGYRWQRDFAHGLTLAFVANGITPRMYIHWNQGRFERFLSKMKEVGCNPSHLFLVEYGICILRRGKRTLVTLPGAGGTKVVLWDSSRRFCQQNSSEDVNWLTGLIKFEEDGFYFLSQAESNEELQEAGAVAKIRITPKPEQKSVPTPVIQAQVTPQTAAYLIQDALTNLFLQTRRTQ